MRLELCTLDGLYYQSGTIIPVKSAYGAQATVFNYATNATTPIDAAGTIKLESDGIYSIQIQRLEIQKVRLKVDPRFYESFKATSLVTKISLRCRHRIRAAGVDK